MGVVYHTHYLDYFEAGRTEALRNLGIRYRDLEAEGIIMPVVNADVRYHAPARYDDELVIRVRFDEIPTVRVPIEYDVCRRNEDKTLTTGHTTLCFMDAERRRPIRAPDAIRSIFRDELSD